jgi:RHS repeat-associated protein
MPSLSLRAAAGNELAGPAGDPGRPSASYSPRNLLRSQFVREYDRCLEEYGSACLQPDPVQEWRSNVYDGKGLRVSSTRTIIALGETSVEGPEPQPDLYFYTPELTMLNIVTPTRTADVIWFGSRPVADHEGTSLRYTFTDHLGTPILQTTSNDAVVWRAEYEPFGNVYALRAGTTTDDQPLRFPGQQVAYRTSSGEENYNIFRWYRSGWGRYTQSDPIGIRGKDPLRDRRRWKSERPVKPSWTSIVGETRTLAEELVGVLEPYAYASDSPLTFKDPLGLSPCPAFRVYPESGYIQGQGLPPGKTIKGCAYVGYCGLAKPKFIGIYEKTDVPIGCQCPKFCLLFIDDFTGEPTKGPLCFDYGFPGVEP